MEAVQRATARRAPGLRVRLLLGLGRTCRRVVDFPRPYDIDTVEFTDNWYDEAVRQGQAVLQRFPDLRGLRVLELGCGHGGMLGALKGRGADAVGVDVDEHRVDYALSRGHTSQVADAANLPFPDSSFDAIVTADTIEHIHDLRGALREAYRVLKPGGHLYAVWGPSWLTYNGPHLIKCLAVPWVHLIFSDRTILRALEHQRDAETWPASYMDYKIADFRAMGRNTRRKLRRDARATGFDIIRDASESRRPLKTAMTRLPLFDELLAGELVVELSVKPAGNR